MADTSDAVLTRGIQSSSERHHSSRMGLYHMLGLAVVRLIEEVPQTRRGTRPARRILTGPEVRHMSYLVRFEA